MASPGLILGLIAACLLCVILIFCCLRSIFRDKETIVRQIKQVRGVNEVDIDDVEASAPPSEEHASKAKQHNLNQQHDYANGLESGLSDDQPKQPVEADGS